MKVAKITEKSGFNRPKTHETACRLCFREGTSAKKMLAFSLRDAREVNRFICLYFRTTGSLRYRMFYKLIGKTFGIRRSRPYVPADLTKQKRSF